MAELLQHNGITLFNDDCVNIMKSLKENKQLVDLTITSPPYDNLRSYNNSSQWNFEKAKEIIKLLYEVTNDGGVVVWVVGDATINGSETGSSFRQALYFMECGFKLHDTMIYEKNSSAFPAKRDSKRYTQIFEYMFVFVKGKMHDCTLLCDKENKWQGWTNWGQHTQYDKEGNLREVSNIKPIPKYSLRNNIWKYSVGFNENKKFGRHPAVFPIQLAVDHILSWSTEDMVIFDPMCGSATVLDACVKTNRKNFIGSEIDREYFDIIKKKFEYYKENGLI